MIDMEKLAAEGKKHGFTNIVYLNVDTIELLPEVREMCASGKCRMYGHNWCCPPGVGTLEECEEKIRKYSHGILVQTVGQLEDAMDGEGMMETQEMHKEAFDEWYPILKEQYPNMMVCGTGACTRCKKCTYPDEPCRFPDYTYGSMEANGMLVSEICKRNDLAYYHGPCTIAYTGCFLLE